MNIFGIGTLEIVIILLIGLLVLKPDDLEKTGRTIGQWINKVTRSEGWTAIRSISKEVRGLPARLAREAELDSLKDQLDPDKMIGGVPALREPNRVAIPEPAESLPVETDSKPTSTDPQSKKPPEKEKNQ